VTEFLRDNLSSPWFYWNTCRPIVKGEWISLYVARLESGSYVYEKHYLVPSKWLYGIYDLESWDGVDKDTINTKHKELKLKNSEFTTVSIVDSLFTKITK
jgi:hypothetical protein